MSVNETKLYIKKFGDLVCRLRKEKGLSQEELGKLGHTSQMTIQRIESATGGTKLESIIAVADGFGLGLVDLFKEVEERAPQEIKDFSAEWRKLSLEVNSLSGDKKRWLIRVLKEIIKYP
ncbi:MAG: helix-turn-helix transcriptional regulator [Oligoflexia bacterium]|nr:helix-turn-helix transcriptional regulator [Oligoflexia bacterium]